MSSGRCNADVETTVHDLQHTPSADPWRCVVGRLEREHTPHPDVSVAARRDQLTKLGADVRLSVQVVPLILALVSCSVAVVSAMAHGELRARVPCRT